MQINTRHNPGKAESINAAARINYTKHQKPAASATKARTRHPRYCRQHAQVIAVPHVFKCIYTHDVMFYLCTMIYDISIHVRIYMFIGLLVHVCVFMCVCVKESMDRMHVLITISIYYEQEIFKLSTR